MAHAVLIGAALGLTAAFVSAVVKATLEVRRGRWDGLEPVEKPLEYR